MKRFILIFLISISVNFTFAESYDKHWGIGIIAVSDINQISEGVYIPENINLYNEKKNKTGDIKNGNYRVAPKISIGSKVFEYRYDKKVAKDFIEVGYEGVVLKYYEEKGDLLKVLVNTSETSCYIKKSDLNKSGYVPMPWMQFLLNKNVEFYAPETGLNLRKGAGIDQEKIVTLRGDVFEIKLTGKTNGLWAEVEVEKYDSHYCTGAHILEQKYKGWIKLLDDKGYPNIWFYSRGC